MDILAQPTRQSKPESTLPAPLTEPRRAVALGIVVDTDPASIAQARVTLAQLGINNHNHPAHKIIDAIQAALVPLTDVYAVTMIHKAKDTIIIATRATLARAVVRAARALHGARAAWIMPINEVDQRVVLQALTSVCERVETAAGLGA